MQAHPKRLEIYDELRPRKARSRKGCLQCRSKRKKCDELRPICTACSRVHSECTWPEKDPGRGKVLQTEVSRVDDIADSSLSLQEPATSRERGRQSVDRELWHHFKENTVPWMLFSKRHAWLIHRYIVPLAQSDELVEHALLAVSGVHLRCAQPAKEQYALYHYDCALRELKSRLANPEATGGTHYRVLLATMVLLCHCEFIDGNTHGGALQHVRACQAFIDPAVKDLDNPDLRHLAVLLLENHGYFAVMGCLHGQGGDELVEMATNFCDYTLPLIRTIPSFGSMFAYEPLAIVVMPTVLGLLNELRQQPSGSKAERSWKYIEHLSGTLEESGPSSVADSSDFTRVLNEQEEIVIQFKLSVFAILVETSAQKCCHQPKASVRSIDTLVSTAENLFKRIEVNDTSYGLLSAILLYGSFLNKASSQAQLLAQTRSFKSSMPLEQRSIDLLTWLWATDGGASGVEGLKMVAKSHGVSAYIC